MTRRWTVPLAVCALVLSACASDRAGLATWNVDSAPDESQAERPSPWGSTASTAVDGVWIFNHQASWGEQARLKGVARIEGDCLLVGEVLVIWHGGRVSTAAELVGAALAGQAPEVALVGGETERVPSVVSQRCSVDHVFLNSVESAAF